jgi:conjugation system TraG family ATPase
MQKTLSQLLPILEISDDGIVSKTGEYSIAYELTKPEIFTLSSSDFDIYHEAWVKAIRLLPLSSILHLQDWYTQSKYQADFEGMDDSMLTRANETFFQERPYLDHRAYLFITLKPANRKPSSSAWSALLDKTLIPEEFLQPAVIQGFLSQTGQFERILSDSGFVRLKRLTSDELTGDPTHAGIIEQYCQLTPHGQALTLGDIDFHQGLRIGNQHCLLYTLADADCLPAQCSPRSDYAPYSTDRHPFPIGFATPLGPLLSCNHIYQQYVFIEDPKATIKGLELKRRRLQSLSAHSRENALTRDAIDAFLNEAISGQRQLVKSHFNVLGWTEDTAGLQELRNRIGSAIAQTGALPHPETVGAPQIWYAGIPGNAADFPMNETFDSFADQAACFLIPETNYRSSISPFGIRLGDRLTGKPVHVDLSDEPMRTGKITNRNKFILGGSGSGKSFFTNHLMRSYYEQNAHIVIVDIGNSYKGLCEFVEGYYFTYTEESPIRFNPFWLPEGETLDTEKKESIKTLLLALWKKDDEAFLRSEYVALSNALQLYYEHLAGNKELFPCFNTFYEFLRDQFVPVLANDRVKEKDFDIDNFLYVLRPFYKRGEYDYLLNAEAHLDLLRQRFIVFELDNIKSHPILFPVVTIIIMETFISKMRKLPGIRKVILIEEAWRAIARQGMSEYIKYLFKTVRKHFGEAIVVTQEVEDIISSPIVKQAIINNADCKILLDQSKFQNKFDEIQDLLGLTEKDKALVLSVNKANEPDRKYKEVFISLGSSHSKVYRTEVSPEEYLTYTTEESEKVLVQEYAAKHGSFRKGVAALATKIREGGKFFILLPCCLLLTLLPSGRATAQIEIIDEAIKAAIMAVDLGVQKIQTETIVLQDAQKQVENLMQQTQLSAITDWVQRQKDLYANYYNELWQVKNALVIYQKVKDMIAKQARLVTDYQRAYGAMRQDTHFSAAELQHIYNVYNGILTQSIANIQQLSLVINALVTQMEDSDRLHIIDAAGDRIDKNYSDLRSFTQENILLSLQRSKDQQDLGFVKSLYNIN